MSRTHVGRFHMLGKRVERSVAITYQNSFKVSPIGNRTSGEGFTRRENERRERFTHRETPVGKTNVGRGVYESENVYRGKMNIGRGVHAWENERREKCSRVGVDMYRK